MADVYDMNESGRQYRNYDLPSTLLDSLNTMRINGEHCDVVLQVGDDKFGAHRVVLAANSTYFRAMFSSTSSFNEAKKREVCLENVNKVALREILTYFYTGKIELNHLKFEDVFVLANMWDVSFIVNVCSEDFLRHELDVSNCLGIQILANKYHNFSSSFQVVLEKFIWKNFMDICREEEFLSLSVERLARILSSDLLRVKSEEIVFEAILRWIGHDRVNREQYLTQLVQEVRLGVLCPSYLTGRVLSEELIQRNSTCMNLVENVFHAMQQTEKNPDLPSVSLVPYFRKRKNDSLFIFGGYVSMAGGQKNEATTVEYLDCSMENGFLERFTPIRVGFCHVAVSGDYLFFIGQGNFRRFNKLSLAWENLYISPEDGNALDITNVAICTCLEYIFVIGGHCNKSFHPGTNLWRNIQAPAHQHYRPGLCCLDDRIYVIGGCDKCYQESVNHVERFDPNLKGWESVSPLPTPRWGLGVAILNNTIYAVGG